MAIIVKHTLPIENILLEDFATVLEMVHSTKVGVRVVRSRGLTPVVEHGDGLLHDINECRKFTGFSCSYWSNGWSGHAWVINGW